LYYGAGKLLCFIASITVLLMYDVQLLMFV
jgi:hypothetical protein